LLEKLQTVAGRFYFPDSRGEWRFFACRKLEQLLDELQPDVVISSHEPATTLEVGRHAKRLGLSWVVDLGDPVLSFYTPARWRRRALVLEGRVCEEADRVIVTTERAKTLLVERHDGDPHRFTVLTQGFDAQSREKAGAQPSVDWSEDRLELLYTGSFYDFREPRALVDAVMSMDGARLTVATSRAPAWLLECAEQLPEKIRLLGFLPHSEVVELQKQAHVLVNLANVDATHVPGKLYEYLGARRPILHVGNGRDDAGADLVRRGAGVVCDNDAVQIKAALVRLHHLRELEPDAEFVPSLLVDEFSWQCIGAELGRVLRAVAV
jgi:glycosyltransferase involved in cell wall biosynthesis